MCVYRELLTLLGRYLFDARFSTNYKIVIVNFYSFTKIQLVQNAFLSGSELVDTLRNPVFLKKRL